NFLQDGGETYRCTTWADIIRLEGAEPLALFGEEWYVGSPAVTVHRFGKGKGIYVGTRPESRYLGRLMESILKERDITPALQVPAKVEVTERYTDKERYVVIVNHNAHPVRITLPADETFLNVFNGKKHDKELTVKGIDAVVLKRRRRT